MQRERFPNPNCVAFHGTRRLIDSSILVFRSKDWKDLEAADDHSFFRRVYSFFSGKAERKYERLENTEKESVQEMVDELFAINGITEVSFNQYSVHLMKGNAFSWDELEPKVVEVLERHRLDLPSEG